MFTFHLSRQKAEDTRALEHLAHPGTGVCNPQPAVHGCRQVSELAYGEELVGKLRDDELFGPLLSEKLLYYPTVTREPFRNRGRITDLISSEQLFNDIHQPPLDIETDRIMMCGSPAMLDELKQMFESGGFVEGSGNKPGHFVIEKAFVER